MPSRHLIAGRALLFQDVRFTNAPESDAGSCIPCQAIGDRPYIMDLTYKQKDPQAGAVKFHVHAIRLSEHPTVGTSIARPKRTVCECAEQQCRILHSLPGDR